MNTKYTVGFIVLVALIAIAAIIFTRGDTSTSGPGPYDAFATCLKDKGATFYGAFWCPHCQEQKSLFGKSADLLPYVECSLPNGQSQNETCNTAGIATYPTWQFADGSRLTGTQALTALAEKTACSLP